MHRVPSQSLCRWLPAPCSARPRRRKPLRRITRWFPPTPSNGAPAPPSRPPGAKAAILLGSPPKDGPFVIRLKFPAGYTVPPHRHSKDEFVTVISGKFVATHGEKVDRAALKFLPPESFIHL